MTHTFCPRTANPLTTRPSLVPASFFPPRKNEMTVNEMIETNKMAKGDQRRTCSLQEAKNSMQSDMCEADMYASAGRTAV